MDNNETHKTKSISIEEKLEILRSKSKDTLSNILGIEFVSCKPESISGVMPVDKIVKQPFGLLHGGASVVFAESLASVGAWLNVDESKFGVCGIEINANHLRPVYGGRLVGKASPVHIGKTTQVWDIAISAEDTGKLVCVSRCTVAVLPLR
jgi:1,4-dihydroxy-2-naphthoyl-CoA hydrolase